MKGILKLNESKDNVEYDVHMPLCFDNLSNLLDGNLFNKVKVEIRNNNNQVIFYARGILLKKKIDGYLWDYFVGNNDLEAVLWNNIGNKIDFRLKILDDEVKIDELIIR